MAPRDSDGCPSDGEKGFDVRTSPDFESGLGWAFSTALYPSLCCFWHQRPQGNALAPRTHMLRLGSLFHRATQPYTSSCRRLATPAQSRMTSTATAEWKAIHDASGLRKCDVISEPMEKSQLDDREYRYIRLPNALEALVISDSKADKAAAALDVGVGHLSDPVSLFDPSRARERASSLAE